MARDIRVDPAQLRGAADRLDRFSEQIADLTATLISESDGLVAAFGTDRYAETLKTGSQGYLNVAANTTALWRSFPARLSGDEGFSSGLRAAAEVFTAADTTSADGFDRVGDWFH